MLVNWVTYAYYWNPVWMKVGGYYVGIVVHTWSLSGSVYSSAPVAAECSLALLDWGWNPPHILPSPNVLSTSYYYISVSSNTHTNTNTHNIIPFATAPIRPTYMQEMFSSNKNKNSGIYVIFWQQMIKWCSSQDSKNIEFYIYGTMPKGKWACDNSVLTAGVRCVILFIFIIDPLHIFFWNTI